MTGSFPDKGLEVDHIDTDGTNNSWSNLRVVSKSVNSRNHTDICNSKSTSGRYGVHFSNYKDRWVANIHIEGKKIHLGNFMTKDEAIKARENAEIELNFKEVA